MKKILYTLLTIASSSSTMHAQVFADFSAYNSSNPTAPFNWTNGFTLTPSVTGTGFSATNVIGGTYSAFGLNNTLVPGVTSGTGEGLVNFVDVGDDYTIQFSLNSVAISNNMGILITDIDTSQTAIVRMFNGASLINMSSYSYTTSVDGILPDDVALADFPIINLGTSWSLASTVGYQTTTTSAWLNIPNGILFDKISVEYIQNAANPINQSEIGLAIWGNPTAIPEVSTLLSSCLSSLFLTFRRKR